MGTYSPSIQEVRLHPLLPSGLGEGVSVHTAADESPMVKCGMSSSRYLDIDLDRRGAA